MSDLLHAATPNGMGGLSQTFARCAAGFLLKAGFNIQCVLFNRFEYLFQDPLFRPRRTIQMAESTQPLQIGWEVYVRHLHGVQEQNTAMLPHICTHSFRNGRFDRGTPANVRLNPCIRMGANLAR